MNEPTSIAQRLQTVTSKIEQAEEDAGRHPGSVTLVAVSKRHSVDAIRQAYAAGCRDFGENYVQELQQKARALADLPGIRWHHIGGLQRNKVKNVVENAHLLQGVDSTRLIETIDQRAGQNGATTSILIQVHLGNEATKGGCQPEQVAELLKLTRSLRHVQTKGLMAIAPASEEPRPHFEKLATIFETHRAEHNLSVLSMGMSADYPVAIAHGATLVRVGSAIFGPRPT